MTVTNCHDKKLHIIAATRTCLMLITAALTRHLDLTR
jgi:hypothetical protein